MAWLCGPAGSACSDVWSIRAVGLRCRSSFLDELSEPALMHQLSIFRWAGSKCDPLLVLPENISRFYVRTGQCSTIHNTCIIFVLKPGLGSDSTWFRSRPIQSTSSIQSSSSIQSTRLIFSYWVPIILCLLLCILLEFPSGMSKEYIYLSICLSVQYCVPVQYRVPD